MTVNDNRENRKGSQIDSSRVMIAGSLISRAINTERAKVWYSIQINNF